MPEELITHVLTTDENPELQLKALWKSDALKKSNSINGTNDNSLDHSSGL